MATAAKIRADKSLDTGTVNFHGILRGNLVMSLQMLSPPPSLDLLFVFDASLVMQGTQVRWWDVAIAMHERTFCLYVTNKFQGLDKP